MASTLADEDLPALFRAADANSLEAQRLVIRLTVLGLVMLVVAAVAGAFVVKIGPADWAGVVAAVAFATTLLVRLYLLSRNPEREWYEGRAVAESAKTLAWRYAVGGAPFCAGNEGLSTEAADALFMERLKDILNDLRGLYLVPTDVGGVEITTTMRQMRTQPLPERKQAYEVGRIDNQRDWYTRKAKDNKNQAQWWGMLLLFLEVMGVLAAIIKAIGVIEIDLLGVTAAATAAGISWLQTKQHATLAEAYAVAAHELAAIKTRIAYLTTDEAWAGFVGDAEEAISREHTLWRASRTAKP